MRIFDRFPNRLMPRRAKATRRTHRRRPAVEALENRFMLAADLLPPLPEMLPGDANQDLTFDQLDLLQALQAGKYLSGEPATWAQGDWDGAPGGSAGNPPAGDGVFDQLDILAALTAGAYGTGAYAAIAPGGVEGDEQTSIIYDPRTGEIAVDAPASTELTSINIDSKAGIFTGEAAQNLGGSGENDSDNNIFKATFGSSFGALTFGNVAQTGLSEEFVRNDLTVVGSLAGGGDLGEVDLIYWCRSGHFFSDQNLTGADFAGQDLTRACFAASNLTNANLAGANLSAAYLWDSNLTGADFTGATVSGATFSGVQGFTTDQLGSTASYQEGDLSGIGLTRTDLTGSNFVGKDLTGANLRGSNLTDADLAGANLTGADLQNSNLTDAEFTDATVAGASFRDAEGLTANQLYGTASYQEGDLSGIGLTRTDLTGGNFVGKDLSDAYLGDVGLSSADLAGANLTGANLWGSNLTGADLAGANLTGADLQNSNLTDAEFTDATVAGASFRDAEGLTANQLYGTASYQEGDLSGIGLTRTDLTGSNFVGKDLSGARLSSSNLSGADLAGANLSGARLSSSNLSGADLAGANLSRASLWGSNLTGVDFTGATVAGATFSGVQGFTTDQLGSTASYQEGDLSWIGLSGTDLTDADLAGANLTGADLQNSNLTGADLAGANLSRARLWSTNLTVADLRGATGFVAGSSTITRNTILPNGTINGLNLRAGDALIIRDSDRAIRVRDSFQVTDRRVLEAVFEDALWSSKIRVEPDVTPHLGGTLKIRFGSDANPSDLVGTTFDLFDWGVALDPSNRFAQVQLPPGTEWDLSHLYDSGEIVLTGVTPPFQPGDADQDLDFDQLDVVLVLQVAKYLTSEPATWSEGDWNGDGVSNQLDIVAALQTGNFMQGPYAVLEVDALFAALGG